MFNRKITILFIILIGILILFLLLRLSNQKIIQTPPPVQIYSPSPTPIRENLEQTDIRQRPFIVVSNTLGQDKLAITEGFTLVFSKPADPNQLSIEVNPSIEIQKIFDRSGSTLTIQPATTWSTNTQYTVTIKGSTKSFDGYNLGNDMNMVFTTEGYKGI